MRKSRTKEIKKKKVTVQSYHKVSLVFVGASLLLLMFVLYLSVSKAIVDITPRERVISVETPARITVEVDEENELPGLVFSERVTRERTFTLSQEDAQPVEDLATGTVTIYNDSTRPQPLIATTRFLSEEGVLFRLDEGVTVQGESAVTATVSADEPGAIGDIGPSDFTIPGLNEARQLEVYAESTDPMTGGIRYIRPLRQSDIDGAVEELKRQMREEKEQEWKETYDTEGFNELYTEAEIIDQQVDVEIGEEVGVFTLILSLELRGVAYAQRSLEEVLGAQIGNALNQGEQIARVNYDAASIEITDIDTNRGEADIILQIDSTAIIAEEHPTVTPDQFVNMSESEVESQLQENELIEEVDVRFIPAWLKRMPTLPDHIEIRIKSIE